MSLPGYCSEVKRRANGTSGDGGVVICRVSGGGVRGAVEGSVVKAEKAGGVTCQQYKIYYFLQSIYTIFF